MNLNCYLYNHSNSLNAGKEKELTQKRHVFYCVFVEPFKTWEFLEITLGPKSLLKKCLLPPVFWVENLWRLEHFLRQRTGAHYFFFSGTFWKLPWKNHCSSFNLNHWLELLLRQTHPPLSRLSASWFSVCFSNSFLGDESRA